MATSPAKVVQMQTCGHIAILELQKSPEGPGKDKYCCFVYINMFTSADVTDQPEDSVKRSASCIHSAVTMLSKF